MIDKPHRNKKGELPPIGTSLTGKFRGVKYHAVIVEDPNSPLLKDVLYEGTLYKTLTAAAKAITGQPTNGWRFWKF